MIAAVVILVVVVDHQDASNTSRGDVACDAAKELVGSEPAPWALPAPSSVVHTNDGTKVKLSPDPSSALLTKAFGQERYAYAWHVSFTADPPLRVKGATLQIFPQGRILRNDTAGSFPLLRFTQPKVSADGEKVRFLVCANPAYGNYDPGEYKGTVALERHPIAGPAPRGLYSEPINVDVTLKDAHILRDVLLPTVLAALLGLILKRFADYSRLLYGNTDEGGRKKIFTWAAFLDYLLAPSSLVTGVAGIGAALAGLRTLYSSNPTFGADFWGTDFWALGAAALSAVGVQSVLDLARAGDADKAIEKSGVKENSGPGNPEWPAGKADGDDEASLPPAHA